MRYRRRDNQRAHNVNCAACQQQAAAPARQQMAAGNQSRVAATYLQHRPQSCPPSSRSDLHQGGGGGGGAGAGAGGYGMPAVPSSALPVAFCLGRRPKAWGAAAWSGGSGACKLAPGGGGPALDRPLPRGIELPNSPTEHRTSQTKSRGTGMFASKRLLRIAPLAPHVLPANGLGSVN